MDVSTSKKLLSILNQCLKEVDEKKIIFFDSLIITGDKELNDLYQEYREILRNKWQTVLSKNSYQMPSAAPSKFAEGKQTKRVYHEI